MKSTQITIKEGSALSFLKAVGLVTSEDERNTRNEKQLIFEALKPVIIIPKLHLAETIAEVIFYLSDDLFYTRGTTEVIKKYSVQSYDDISYKLVLV